MKNLSLYEKIDRVCRLGKHAIVEDNMECFVIVSPYKDASGRWRKSYRLTKPDISAESIGSCIGDLPHEWILFEKMGWKYIGVWTPPTYERFEVGDKVINKLCISLYHGDTGVVEEVNYADKYIVRFPSHQQLNSFSDVELLHKHLEPVFEEEEETVEVLGKNYKKSELEERLKELKEVEE